MQAEGRQFDSVRLHQTYDRLNLERRLQEAEDFEPGFSPAAAMKGGKFFDN